MAQEAPPLTIATDEEDEMSLEAWGDEGNVPENGKDTAIYQELLTLRVKLAKWQKDNRNDFANDEQLERSYLIIDAVDALLDELADIA